MISLQPIEKSFFLVLEASKTMALKLLSDVQLSSCEIEPTMLVEDLHALSRLSPASNDKYLPWTAMTLCDEKVV